MDAEQTPSPSEPGPATEENSDSRKSYTRIFFPMFAVILLLAGASGAYYAWMELNKRLDEAAEQRQSLAHDIATIDDSAVFLDFKNNWQGQVSTLDQRISTLSEGLKELAGRQENIRRHVQQSLARINRGQLEWGLSETLQVLHMANHRLLIERDIEGTTTALNLASKRLHGLNDPRLLPVRESISRQIGKLENTPVPDWVGISLKLNNTLARLRQDIAGAATARRPQPESSSADSNENKQTPWQKLAGQVKVFIDDSIKITRKEQPSSMLVNGQDKELIHEFLRARLLSAQYALANRDDQSYHQELEAAMAWLEKSTHLTGLSHLANELEDLNSVNLKPELPDISEPSMLLAELLEKIESR